MLSQPKIGVSMKEIEYVICFFYLKFVVSTVHSAQCAVCGVWFV